jgi:hypothetical protein
MTSIRESFLIQLEQSGVREFLRGITIANTLGDASHTARRALQRLDELTANIRSQIEQDVYSKDLAVKHFPGKWKEAKRMAGDRLNAEEGVEYWLLVRRFYLELGGEYVEQLQPRERREYEEV